MTSPCSLASSNANQKGESTMNIDKPYLVLDVDFAGCSYIPSVNGVTFKDILGGEKGVIATDIPINQWLKPGKNEFSLILKPSDHAEKLKGMGQDCQAKVTLKVKPDDKPITIDDSNYTSIFTFNYQSAPDEMTTNKKHFKGTTEASQLDSSKDFKRVDSGGDIQIGPIHIEQIDTEYGPGVKMTREVDIPLPFPKWAWFDGDQIPDNEETKQELIKQYQKIWDALNNQNIQSLAPEFQQRIKEYAQAYYVPEKKMNFVNDLQEAQKDPQKKLGDFIPKYEYLQVFGDGKLARLTIWDGTEAIYFNHKDKDLSDNYDFVFMKKDGKWQVIR